MRQTPLRSTPPLPPSSPHINQSRPLQPHGIHLLQPYFFFAFFFFFSFYYLAVKNKHTHIQHRLHCRINNSEEIPSKACITVSLQLYRNVYTFHGCLVYAEESQLRIEYSFSIDNLNRDVPYQVIIRIAPTHCRLS